MTRYEYWMAENTGWSGGVSWFPTSSTHFTSRSAAEDAAKRFKETLNQKGTKHRVKHYIVSTESFEV